LVYNDVNVNIILIQFYLVSFSAKAEFSKALVTPNKILAANLANSSWHFSGISVVVVLDASGDLITTQGILNNAATVSTSTAIAPTDAAFLTVEVLVNKAGVVTCKLNDVTYPVYSVGTTALVFDAGDIMIPFVRSVNIGGGDPDLVLNEFAAVPTSTWKA